MAPKPVLRGRLTRRFLMTLETGLYIVSNCYEHVGAGRYEPCFRESVVPPEARNEQWARIKSAYVDGRLCDVLSRETDYNAYRASMPAPSGQGAPPSA